MLYYIYIYKILFKYIYQKYLERIQKKESISEIYIYCFFR